MQKTIFFFFIFYAYNLPAGTLSSVFKTKRGRNGSKKQKTCILNVSWNLIWQPSNAWEAPFCQKSQNRCTLLNTFMRKGKHPEPDPYLSLMDPNPDPEPGGPKTCGSPTLFIGGGDPGPGEE
jgi:hypothetical protein